MLLLHCSHNVLNLYKLAGTTASLQLVLQQNYAASCMLAREDKSC